MTAFETPSAGGDARLGFQTPGMGGATPSEDTPPTFDARYIPRTGSSVGTVTGTLSFCDTFSSSRASAGCTVHLGDTQLPQRDSSGSESDWDNTRVASDGGGSIGGGGRKPGGGGGSVRGVVCGPPQEPTDALDAAFDISYLVPKVDGGYFGEILVAVPKTRGDGDADSKCSVFNNTLFRFPIPKSNEVNLICDRKHLRRNAGDDDSEIWTRRYSVPAFGNIPAVPLCTQKKLWLNRYAVLKLIEGGFLRGPQNMWLSKDAEYIQRVHRLVSATVDAVRLDSEEDSFENQIADELYIIDEVAPVSSDDVGTKRPKRRSPITQHAKYLVKNFETLCGLLATLSIVLTYGKKASIATQMQREYDVKQASEQDVVCDQLLDVMRMGKETKAAAAFRKSLPPPLREPMSIDDFENAMNKALRQLTRGAGARESAGEEGGPQVGGPDVSARTWGILFTLTHLFPSQEEHVVGGGDATMFVSDIGEASLESAETKTPDHHRWIVRQLLESVMQAAHPRLTFVMGPCLRAFSHLHGVPHRILDIW